PTQNPDEYRDRIGREPKSLKKEIGEVGAGAARQIQCLDAGGRCVQRRIKRIVRREADENKKASEQIHYRDGFVSLECRVGPKFFIRRCAEGYGQSAYHYARARRRLLTWGLPFRLPPGLTRLGRAGSKACGSLNACPASLLSISLRHAL